MTLGKARRVGQAAPDGLARRVGQAAPVGLPRAIWAIAPLAVVGALVIIPVAAVVIAGLGTQAWETLVAPATWRIVAYTAIQAAISTVLSLLLALPAAYALYRLEIPARRTLLAIITVPFILPTIVVGLAFREILPFAGTTAAIIVAHVFFNVGLVVRIVGGLWGHLDARLLDVSRTLGIGPARTFARVTLPLLRPALLGAAALVFLFTFTSFGVVLVLGDPSLPTLAVEIYSATVQRLDFPAAAGLALLQFVFVAVAVVWSARLQERVAVRQHLGDDDRRAPVSSAPERLAVAYTWTLAAAIVIPLLGLLLRSLRVGEGWGFAWYAEAFSPAEATTRSASAFESLALSLQYAAIASHARASSRQAGAAHGSTPHWRCPSASPPSRSASGCCSCHCADRSICAGGGCSYPWVRHWWRCRSSSAWSCHCCAPSTRACARWRRRSAPHRCARGGPRRAVWRCAR